MDEITREKLLKIALVIFGAIFFTIYPLGLIWPSGWQWHSGHGQYYLQMICGVYAVLGAFLIAAARNPSEHRSLISFTVWSSIVHASIMAIQAIYDGHEIGHFWRRACATVGRCCALVFLSREAAASGQRIANVALPAHRYLMQDTPLDNTSGSFHS
jgi:FtsH-binding integral membrane protein